jgi:hypothetical protein
MSAAQLILNSRPLCGNLPEPTGTEVGPSCCEVYRIGFEDTSFLISSRYHLEHFSILHEPPLGQRCPSGGNAAGHDDLKTGVVTVQDPSASTKAGSIWSRNLSTAARYGTGARKSARGGKSWTCWWAWRRGCCWLQGYNELAGSARTLPAPGEEHHEP